MVMFWVRAMSMASSVSSRVVRVPISSYIFVRSCVVGFVSSFFRSLIRFACFHMAFKPSANAMSTVCRV